jgi:oxygen-independent coproporphyrinogen-3 oxidase
VGGEQTQLLAAGGAAGLYVHIPFCLRKCPYCDFYSITDLSLAPSFLQSLKKEISIGSRVALQFDTLYIGGGTPSVLRPDIIGEIVKTAYQNLNILPDCEITIEVNPGTVKAQELLDYRQIGINRVNIGVQSFHCQNLKFLGRIHSAKDAANTFKWARDAGFKNVGLDLIYGIPGQTKSYWLEDLEKALSFKPEHLSCYMLTYEQGTPMDRSRRKNCFQPMAEKKVGELFKITAEYLVARNYRQYEIANFAISNALRSRHNQKYWSFAPYIGFGPAAHSFLEPLRYWNHSDINQYISDLAAEQQPIAGKEQLTEKQLMIEAIYLGLRKVEGIDLDEFEHRFGRSFYRLFEEEIKDFKDKGYLQVTEKHCALTREGMLFLDSIAAAFTGKDLT